MAGTVAELGFKIDSTPIDKASSSLKDLKTNAAEAAASTKTLQGTNDNLGKATAVMGKDVQNAFAAIRSATEGTIGSITKSIQSGIPATQAFSQALGTATTAATTIKTASTASMGALATGATLATGPIGLIADGLVAAGIAAYKLYSAVNDNSAEMEKHLEAQKTLVDQIKNAFSGAKTEAAAFYENSRQVLLMLSKFSAIHLQADLVQAAKKAAPSAPVISVPEGREREFQNILKTQGLPPGFAEFAPAIREFNKEAAEGNPDVKKYRDSIAGIVNSSSDLATIKAGETLTKMSDDSNNLTNKLTQVKAGMDVLNGTAGKTQKEILGISTAVKKTHGAFDSVEGSIRKHIAAMEADAKTVGLTRGEHEQARVEAQLMEAGLKKGLTPEVIKASAAWRELGPAAKAAADALALAKINSDIKFGKGTSLLTEEDVSIAERLRGIYGNDIPKALASAQAAAMRLNNAMSDISKAFSTGLTTAIEDVVNGTKNAKEAFKDFGMVVVKAMEEAIIKMTIVGPLMRSLQGMMSGGGGLLSIFGLANGGVLSGGQLQPYAMGGVVNSPTIFPMANGTGLMGEAGPEAIMPLKRTAGGRLGVEMAGGAGIQGGGSITFAPVINAPGATKEDMAAALAQAQRDFKNQIVPVVKDAQSRGIIKVNSR